MSEEILSLYVDFVKEFGRRPKSTDLYALGVTNSKIKHHFANMSGLHYQAEALVQDLILTESIYDKKNTKDEIQKKMLKSKKAFVTCAVSDRKVDKDAFAAAKDYCKKNNALLIIMPAKDLGNAGKSNVDDYNLDPILANEVILFHDYKFCDKLLLSGIKINAKQIYPGTGLKRLCSKDGSFIVGGTKQFLHHVAQNHASEYPHMVAVTGAITENNYSSPNYMSARTARMAETDHMIGGLVIETDGSVFNARHVTYNNGCFITNGKKYGNGSSKKKPKCLAFKGGDLHPGQEDKNAINLAIKQLIKPHKPERIIIGDAFDGATFNRHVVGKIKETSIIRNQFPSMADEFEYAIKCWTQFADLCEVLQLTPSNHPDWIDQFITKGDFSKINNLEDMELCGHLFSACARDENLVKAGAEFVAKSRNLRFPKNIIFPDRLDSIVIGGYETNIHGDLGPNGSRGTPANLEAAYGKGISEHTHSASIIRWFLTVGTLTKLRQSYNKGPSPWTHSNALIWENDTAEIYTLIKGKYFR